MSTRRADEHQGAETPATRLAILSLRDSLLQISQLSAWHADRFAKGFAGRIATTVKTNGPSVGALGWPSSLTRCRGLCASKWLAGCHPPPCDATHACT